ncbi:MAG TPA: M1 family aminopeptidase [Blastocatellia bacterium]|nr:M1 family aminopeptidase [Blastocatellia bacterium]
MLAQTDEPRLSSFSEQSYRIELEVDEQEQSYVGSEIVRFTNSTRRELDQINFHLYPNLGQKEDDFPWLTVNGVGLTPNQHHRAAKGQGVRFALRAHNSILQVKLPFKLAPGSTLELKIDFAARIPRIQREETTLLAHFLEEASDAISDEKQSRDARDIFFACEQTILLGYFYPLLAAPETSSTDQGLAIGVGGLVISEVADYEVKVNVDADIMAVGSSRLVEKKSEAEKTITHVFRGENLRGFALVLGEHWKTIERKNGATTLATYYLPGDEKIGHRMADIAVNTNKAYNTAFGQYPYQQLNVVELPLPAGFGGIEFPGLVAIAQAYCIDFDAPEAARLPGLVRDQADVIKNALEFTLAQSIAFQWWGGVVGSDSQRSPYLDEALAHFAATYYYEATFGKEAGEKAISQNIRTPYQVYRSLGGVDMEVAKPTKDFRNALQFSAIVQAKGAMLFQTLRRELGDEQFFGALRLYYTTRKFRFATPNDLREAFLTAAQHPATVKNLFQRYLREKRGDEDLGVPEVAYFSANEKGKGRKLGRFFGKIGRAAARPF